MKRKFEGNVKEEKADDNKKKMKKLQSEWDTVTDLEYDHLKLLAYSKKTGFQLPCQEKIEQTVTSKLHLAPFMPQLLTDRENKFPINSFTFSLIPTKQVNHVSPSTSSTLPLSTALSQSLTVPKRKSSQHPLMLNKWKMQAYLCLLSLIHADVINFVLLYCGMNDLSLLKKVEFSRDWSQSPGLTLSEMHSSLRFLCIDDKSNEIFMTNNTKSHGFVFDIDTGGFKRKFPFFPDSKFGELVGHNFLICRNEMLAVGLQLIFAIDTITGFKRTIIDKHSIRAPFVWHPYIGMCLNNNYLVVWSNSSPINDATALYLFDHNDDFKHINTITEIMQPFMHFTIDNNIIYYQHKYSKKIYAYDLNIKDKQKGVVRQIDLTFNKDLVELIEFPEEWKIPSNESVLATKISLNVYGNQLIFSVPRKKFVVIVDLDTAFVQIFDTKSINLINAGVSWTVLQPQGKLVATDGIDNCLYIFV